MFEIERQGAVFVFRGQQPLCGEYADDATQAMREAATGGQPLAVLDMQSVALIDGRGLETLLQAQDEFETRGGCLKLAAANGLCRDILRCTGVAERFELHSDIRSAVGSFAK